MVPADWLPAQALGADTGDRPFTPQTGTGGLINYDLYATNPGRQQANASILSEQRLFGAWGTLSNAGAYRHTPNQSENGYIRYDTRFTYSDTDQIRTTTAGDLIAAPLSWGSAVRLGGLQFARNFAVRPDLVTYPLPKFAGQAAVPSAVDLFINGYKAGSEQVQPGPFTLNTMPYINGAGEASVVTTDALGRQVVTTTPFYVANTLLKKGLDDYSVAAGALRRAYGQKNFAYGRPAGSAAYRLGASDSLTLEGRAEAAPDLTVLGVGGVGALGAWGVINAATSGSQERGHSGGQLNLGYQFNGRNFGFGAQQTLRTSGYADLSTYDSPGLRLARRTSQVNTSIAMGDAGAFAAGYFDALDADQQRTRLLSLNYSKPVGTNAFVSVNLNKVVGGRDLSLQFQLTFALDNRGSLTLAATRDRDHTSGQVNYSRTPPSEGGFGWNVAYADSTGQDNNTGRYSQASTTWRGEATQLQGGVYTQGRISTTWLGATGSLVMMDGGVFPANRINDAFVLVSTNGVAGVPILYENQVIGRTDTAGHMLVPSVPGFYPARIDVDVLNLPDHLQLIQSQQRLTVRSGSGALLRFDIESMLAARITLIDDHGRPLPVGWQVRHVQSGQNAVVGWDGLVYFEKLKAQNELVVQGPGNVSCRVHFPVVVTAPQVLRIGPLTCRPEQATRTAMAGHTRQSSIRQ